MEAFNALKQTKTYNVLRLQNTAPGTAKIELGAKFCQLIASLSVTLPQFKFTKLKLQKLKFEFC